jgi:hypothetical protein
MFKKLAAVMLATAIAFAGLTSSASASNTISTTYVEGTDDAAALYNPLVVNTFNLTLPASTIAGLNGSTNNWSDEGPYLPADMSGTVNGVAFGPLHVGIHLKGAWGSWRNIYGKAGFKIKINFVDKNATFYGVQKLTLNNMVQDHSSIHETLSYRLFRSIGVPTARTGYANVTVNGQNYGLHLNLETTDKTLMNHWGITPSHIYKGGVPYFPDFWPGQESHFAIDQGSTTDLSDLTALMNVVNRGNGVNWYHDMSQIADLEEMTLDWAAESFVGHWDGYVHNHNNFYLVKRQDGKFIMLPWGMDQTWGGTVDYWSGAALLSQCLNDTKCLALYNKALVKVVNTASDLKLPAEATAVAAAINPTLYADTKKEFGNDEIPGDQNWTKSFIASQIQNGLQMVAAFDASLKDFGAAGTTTYIAPDQVLTVANSVSSIQLVGRANSQFATVAPTTAALNVGDNNVVLVVSNASGHTTQSFTVVVHRRALVTHNLVLSFTKTGYTLSPSGIAALRAALGGVSNPANQTLAFTMPAPAAMSKVAATALLTSRYNAVKKVLAAAGFANPRVTLVVAKGTTSTSMKVVLGYEN